MSNPIVTTNAVNPAALQHSAHRFLPRRAAIAADLATNMLQSRSAGGLDPPPTRSS
jgi:hypothetical protein